MTFKCTRVPDPSHPSYIAAKAMLNRPPLSAQEVLALADFGPEKTRMAKLRDALRNRWLIEIPGGRIIASEFAQDHFDQPQPVAKFAGTTATSRENVNAMKPLSLKHRLNPRGLRADALDNSLAAMPSHFAKVMP